MIEWDGDLRECSIAKDLNRAFHIGSDKELDLLRDKLLIFTFVLLHDCLKCHSNCPVHRRFEVTSEYVQGTHEIAGLYCRNNISNDELDIFWTYCDMKETEKGTLTIQGLKRTSLLRSPLKKKYHKLRLQFRKLTSISPLSYILDASIPLQQVVDDLFGLMAGLIEQIKVNDTNDFKTLIDICELKERTLPCFRTSIRHVRWSVDDVVSVIKNSYLFCVVPWLIALFSHLPWDLNDVNSMQLFRQVWQYCGFEDDERTDQLLCIAKLSLSALIMIGNRIKENKDDHDYDDQYYLFLSRVQGLISNGFISCDNHKQNDVISDDHLCGQCLITKANTMRYPIKKYNIQQLPSDDTELNNQFAKRMRLELDRITIMRVNERFLLFASWINYEFVAYPILCCGDIKMLFCFFLVESVLMIRIFIWMVYHNIRFNIFPRELPG